MVSAEVSCDLCLKEALKAQKEQEYTRSNTCTPHIAISYVADLGNKLDSIGSDVEGIQLPSSHAHAPVIRGSEGEQRDSWKQTGRRVGF